MQFQGDNAIIFDANNLSMSKPKPKTRKTDNGTVDYQLAFINYNQGTVERPKTKAFVIELPEVTCHGITQKYANPTCGFLLEVDNEVQSNVIDIFKETEDFVIGEVFKKKDIFKKFSMHQSSETLKNFINPILRYRKDETTGEITDENPSVYVNLYTSGWGGPPKFIGIDGKKIHWSKLKGTKFRCVPTLKVADFYMSSTANTIRTQFVKAIVTEIDTDAARDAEIIEKFSGNMDEFTKNINDLLSLTDKSEEKQSFQFESGMINTNQFDQTYNQLQIQPSQSQEQSQPQQPFQGQPQGQFQGQPQPQQPFQDQPQQPFQGQPQGQFQGQPQGQFQGQPQGQFQGQPQGQFQGQPQGQFQGQPQGQFQHGKNIDIEGFLKQS
uniref:Uncharacterized protein n=1 Tax=Pithovirus LCPAC406 TaxID=2506599 RepID=A0A481ZD98_9VIRU|nr:MAG: hypothetical protein LCPAC406_00710 [Pithovirus LCPAC406]